MDRLRLQFNALRVFIIVLTHLGLVDDASGSSNTYGDKGMDKSGT